MTYMKPLLALLAVCMLWACDAPRTAPAASSDADKAVVEKDKVEPATVVLDTSIYGMLGNMEMVQYCLPFPKQFFKENYALAEAKGEHVFVSQDGQSKIVYAGNPTQLTLDALFLDVSQDLEKKGLGGNHTFYRGKAGFFFSWQEGEVNHYMKKWYRAAEMETVTVHFQYRETAGYDFDAWIDVITLHDPTCTD
jgi:hypothetical protein